MTATKVHTRLREERGRAAEYVCECGQPAVDWAYQYNGDPELYDPKGRPYSEDIGCYAPMCRGCHRRLDVSTDPRLVGRYRELGRKQVQYLAGLRESDPDFAAKMKEVGQKLGAHQLKLRQENPVYDIRMREIGKRNIRAALQSTKDRMSDPEFAAKVSADRAAAARQANSIKRTCAECGKTATPAGIGRHQKSSGHKGYTDR